MKLMPSPERQRGLTLVEMLVAVAIGLIVTAAITAVFMQSRISASQDENLARMQENARFALNLLRSELMHADLMAELVDGGSSIAVPATLAAAADCSNSGGEKWLYQLANPNKRLFHMNNVVDATAAATAYDCIDADFKQGTDILAVQRLLAAPEDADDLPAAANNAVYVRASMSNAEMFHHNGGTPPTITGARDWPYIARIYYVNSEDQLVREGLTAAATPTMTREPLVDGIDRFHIEFGIDTNDDGIANYYQPAPSPAQVLNLVTARIFVLARSPAGENQLTLPDKTYRLGSETVGPFGDAFYRRVYTTTVMVRNFTYRAGLGER